MKIQQYLLTPLFFSVFFSYSSDHIYHIKKAEEILSLDLLISSMLYSRAIIHGVIYNQNVPQQTLINVYHDSNHAQDLFYQKIYVDCNTHLNNSQTIHYKKIKKIDKLTSIKYELIKNLIEPFTCTHGLISQEFENIKINEIVGINHQITEDEQNLNDYITKQYSICTNLLKELITFPEKKILQEHAYWAKKSNETLKNQLVKFKTEHNITPDQIIPLHCVFPILQMDSLIHNCAIIQRFEI